MYHPQLHLQISKVPFACIAIDAIGKLSTTSLGNKYALTCIDLLTSYVIVVPISDKTAESIVEAYLSSILFRAGASYGLPFRQSLWIKKTVKWIQF